MVEREQLDALCGREGWSWSTREPVGLDTWWRGRLVAGGMVLEVLAMSEAEAIAGMARVGAALVAEPRRALARCVRSRADLLGEDIRRMHEMPISTEQVQAVLDALAGWGQEIAPHGTAEALAALTDECPDCEGTQSCGDGDYGGRPCTRCVWGRIIRPVAARALAEFHEHPNALIEGTNTQALRKTLHEEEHKELIVELDMAAAGLPDFGQIARELGDVVYVVYGTAWAFGIDLDAALVEIHRAAMDKMNAGLRRADGKILKPPGFRAPDMTAAIAGAELRPAPARQAEEGSNA